MQESGQIHSPVALGLGAMPSVLFEEGDLFVPRGCREHCRREIWFVLGENRKMMPSGVRCVNQTVFLILCPSTSVILCA